MAFINTNIPERTRNSPPTPRSNLSQSSMGTIDTPTNSQTTLPPILTHPVVKLEDTKYPATAYYSTQSSSSPPTSYSSEVKAETTYFPGQPSSSRTASSDHTLSPVPAPAAITKEVRRGLDNAEETLYMQVFVEEVGIWMDSMDPLKHVCTTATVLSLTCC